MDRVGPVTSSVATVSVALVEVLLMCCPPAPADLAKVHFMAAAGMTSIPGVVKSASGFIDSHKQSLSYKLCLTRTSSNLTRVSPTVDARVTLEVSRRTATITLNSPQTRNALSLELIAELLQAIKLAAVSDSRVVVLTHTPPVFCSGLDLNQVAGGSVDLSGLENVILALRRVRQPTIAVLTGAVRAGGLGIMAACDLVVVAPTVNFAFTEVKLGAAPALISVPILARVAWSKVAAAFLTGDQFDADRALAIGLVTHVSDDPHDTAQRLIDAICAAGPEAVATTTKILRRTTDDSYESKLAGMRELSERVFASAEAREGIAAFLEKRPPSWKT